MAGQIEVYAAKMRDGTYRCVEAVSWKDARRHLGWHKVASVQKRLISLEDFHEQTFSEAARQRIYERGRRTSA